MFFYFSYILSPVFSSVRTSYYVKLQIFTLQLSITLLSIRTTGLAGGLFKPYKGLLPAHPAKKVSSTETYIYQYMKLFCIYYLYVIPQNETVSYQNLSDDMARKMSSALKTMCRLTSTFLTKSLLSRFHCRFSIVWIHGSVKPELS